MCVLPEEGPWRLSFSLVFSQFADLEGTPLPGIVQGVGAILAG
jgi:hypothetical protein